MSKLKLFLFRMHQLFGMHEFQLKPTGYGSFRGRCSCGAMLTRGAPMHVVNDGKVIFK